MLRHIFFIYLLLAGSAIAVAQPNSKQYQFGRIDINNGLSNNQVTCIFKDSRGFMWFGTMSGLNRYDGYRFKIFRHDAKDATSINDNFIIRILEMPDGKLLVQTRNWLNLYDPVTETFAHGLDAYFKPLNLPIATILNCEKNNEGGYYFLFDTSGLYQYKSALNKSVQLASSGISKEERIVSFSQDSKGNIWIIRNNGVIQTISSKTGTIIFTSNILSSFTNQEQLSYHLFIDAQDELWIYIDGDPRGIFRYNTLENKLTHINKSTGNFRLNTDLVLSVLQDNYARIWVCTDHGGINIIDKQQKEVHSLVNNADDASTLSQNSITAAYKDDLGMMWVGTYKKGINYYHESLMKFPLYRHQSSNPASLGFDDVNKFAEDARGNIWIGTNGGGLIYFDRQKNTFKQYKHQPGNANSLSNDVIVSLCVDRAHKLWIGTYFGGLDCFDGSTFKHYRNNPLDSNSLADNRVYEIYEDSNNNLWIGTLNAGLEKLDRTTGIFHHHDIRNGQMGSNYISDIKEDKLHNLWIGTAGGLEVLNAGSNKFLHFDVASGAGSNNVLSICIDSKDRIWVGSREGLHLFNKDPKKQLHFGIADGLSDNSVLNILEDEKNNLWVSTPKGISSLSITSGEKGLTINSKNYDETDGLQGKEFNENAALKTSKDELIFGGPNGFNLFDPRNIVYAKHKPLVVFTDFALFNESISPGEEVQGKVPLREAIDQVKSISLNYNQNVFAVEFAALDYFNADKIRYAYKMEGFNKDWLLADGKIRKAVFTNLDPGTYTLRIKTAASDDVWTESRNALIITIRPPFWKTPLAYFLYFVFLSFLLYFVRRTELQKARMKFSLAQERREAHRMHELDLMRIKFFTNVSHEFRTPLSLILTPVEKMLKSAADTSSKQQLHLIYRNAKRLLNLVNQLLDFRKMEEKELQLDLTQGDIIKYINDVSHFFTDVANKKNISFSFNTNTDVFETSFDQDKVERILFNLLSNAFKFTPDGGHVSVEVEAALIENDLYRLMVKVRDTGIGIEPGKQEKIFERFFQNDLPASMVNQGSGIGLAITKEFVKLHGGFLEVESEPGKGSCFIVYFQLRRQPAADSFKEENLITPGAAEEIEAVSTTQAEELENRKIPARLVKKHSVLLVEDNEDFRFYLKDNLREYFTIIEAANGKQGWQKALAAHPNLVVSDISMPEMDGIELCKKIKQDKRTSHIPVILLTALTGEEQQLKGLETGANDYLTKPFNFEILLSKIKNQLNQQQQFKETYQKQVEAKPSDVVVVVSPNEKFMQQLLALVEKNISEPDFSVEEMSREMYMSRVALYKKVLSLTGKTPIEFIREIRLKRAAQLLEKTKMTVAEVAYEVGFNNPKYFAKYFKAAYELLPSAYIQEKRNLPEDYQPKDIL